MHAGLTERSATELARAIRSREVSARDVIEAHIEVLERIQPRINAIAVDRFDRARSEADAVDARLNSARSDEALPPFLGVPCTIKEVLNVEGLPNTGGMFGRQGVIASSTATAARRLLNGGAILLGLTNTAEFALWYETENVVYGRTGNPYDASRIAGGSSGGCGAAVGSGGSPMSLGTDAGGSIRNPAFLCGVFGHRPSRGLVPLTADIPPLTGVSRLTVGYGPLARRAEDLMPFLRLIAGPDGLDPTAADITLEEPADVSLDGLPVLVPERAFLGRISREVRGARERAAVALEARGARIEHVSLRRMRRMMETLLAMFNDAGRTNLAEAFELAGCTPARMRDVIRRSAPYSAPMRMWVMADAGGRFMPSSYLKRCVDRGKTFTDDLADMIGEGVLLHPPFARAAPPHRWTYPRFPWVGHPTAVFNVTGFPVTEVPLGLNADGLPLGVQVAAGPGRDHVSIAVALELERAFGGWVPPNP